MSDPFAGFEDLSAEPLEVRLVAETTKCRACDWFCRPPPYGPYPSFDFTTDYPEVLRERTTRQFRDGDHVRDISGTSQSQATVNPQILHGCRKAPVMTIGINPNLTGFWPGTNGARWAYPLFSSFKRYAYYYRHRTTYQESLQLDFIRKHIRDGGAIKAKKPGHVAQTGREMDARKLTIELAFEDGTNERLEQTWDHSNHFVLLLDRGQSFQAGNVIGGFLDLPAGHEIPVQQNVVGYYQRVIPILEQVSAWLRSQNHLPNLEMAEDVCQLDMVACASPGWGRAYEIDKREVVGKCVQENAWVIKQLIQSNPKVIVFSGRSAFQMFNRMFASFIIPKLQDDMEVYGLMKMTARDPHYLDIRQQVADRDYHLRARVIIAPHFSYDDNFEPHARLSAEELADFSSKYARAYSDLESDGRITKPNRDGYVGIRLNDLQDWATKHAVAAIPLMQKIYDASALIGQGITQEILLGRIGYDSSNNHLERAVGPCRFCSNGQWSFPEGCAYGKPDEPAWPNGFLETIADQIISQLQPAGDGIV